MKFEIKREKWVHGSSIDKGRILMINRQGNQDILGHLASLVGVKSHQLIGMGTTWKLLDSGEAFDKFPELFSDTMLIADLCTVNDNPFLEVEERESKIKDLLSKYNHEIEFI